MFRDGVPEKISNFPGTRVWGRLDLPKIVSSHSLSSRAHSDSTVYTDAVCSQCGILQETFIQKNTGSLHWHNRAAVRLAKRPRQTENDRKLSGAVGWLWHDGGKPLETASGGHYRHSENRFPHGGLDRWGWENSSAVFFDAVQIVGETHSSAVCFWRKGPTLIELLFLRSRW